jgi:hypothetical protein
VPQHKEERVIGFRLVDRHLLAEHNRKIFSAIQTETKRKFKETATAQLTVKQSIAQLLKAFPLEEFTIKEIVFRLSLRSIGSTRINLQELTAEGVIEKVPRARKDGNSWVSVWKFKEKKKDE